MIYYSRQNVERKKEAEELAVKLIEETNVLTLDFWEENVFYEGKEFPAGTLACHALNIPDEVISQMETLCYNLNTFMGTFNAGKANPALLPAARQSALRLFALMMEHKPFSCINADVFKGMIEKAFTANSVKIANAFIQAQRSGKLTDQLEGRYQDGILLCRLLPVLAHLGYSLKEFKKTMIPFAEKIHEAEKRIDVTYAEIFQQYFPKDPTFEDAGGWMSMTNVTQQYLTILHPQKETPLLVKRMHYVSFVGMLRGDYFEGLRNGNGPKKCKNCGRWFLTTNAYLIKYCDNIAPGDSRNRTCRSVGAKAGDKEDPQGHPIKRIYETRRNSVSKAVHRGTMDKELADMIMKLAEEKKTKAFMNNGYFQNHYEKEMQVDAIKTEALARMGRTE